MTLEGHIICPVITYCMDSSIIYNEGGAPQTAQNEPEAMETEITGSTESIFNPLEILRPDSVCSSELLKSDDDISVITGNSKTEETENQSEKKLRIMDNGFIRFGNASQRRRFNQAIKEGLSREEAIARASKPGGAPNTTATRAPVKPTKPETATYAKALSTVKMGIIPKDVHRHPLSKDQMDKIQKEILNEVKRNKEPKLLLFEGSFHKAGWLTVVCSNAETAEWLRNKFPSIKKECGMEISLAEEGQLPKQLMVRGYFPTSKEESDQDILGYLESQNAIPAKEWQVVTRKTEGKMEHLVFAVDKKSWDAVEAKKGLMGYKFGSVRLILIAKKRHAEEEQGESDKMQEEVRRAPEGNTTGKEKTKLASSNLGWKAIRPSGANAALSKKAKLCPRERVKAMEATPSSSSKKDAEPDQRTLSPIVEASSPKSQPTGAALVPPPKEAKPGRRPKGQSWQSMGPSVETRAGRGGRANQRQALVHNNVENGQQ